MSDAQPDVPYVAPCPACGADAPWRSVLARIERPYISGPDTVVEAHCDCTCAVAA